MAFSWLTFIVGIFYLLYWFLSLSIFAEKTVKSDRAYISSKGTSASMVKGLYKILLPLFLVFVAFLQAKYRWIWGVALGLLLLSVCIMIIAIIILKQTKVVDTEKNIEIRYPDEQLENNVKSRRLVSILPAIFLLLWIVSWSDLY